uniref:Uncharacterized protein n=1 Tax=Lotus japonicus TaxID=34305 RepID=I3T0R2_LOTJA|nr:unknown [Lotus japonicus]
MRGLSQGLGKVSPTLVKSVSAAFLILSASVLWVARLLELPRILKRRRSSQWQWHQILRIHTAATVTVAGRTFTTTTTTTTTKSRASHHPHRLQLQLITEQPRGGREYLTEPQWWG